MAISTQGDDFYDTFKSSNGKLIHQRVWSPMRRYGGVNRS